jgi:predicted DNA-binding WGR domain protein
MERYELVEGTSSKFWEVEVAGSDLTVCFGRIGTAGQSKTKSFADGAAASKEYAKLVKEKTGKGYALVATGGSLPAKPAAAPAKPAAAAPVAASAAAPVAAPVALAAPVAAPKPPAQAVASAAPVTTAAPATPSPAAVAAAAAIEWPSGGFQWKADWQKSIPIVRGVNVPPLPQDMKLLGNLVVLEDDRYKLNRLGELATAAGKPWTYWGPKQSKTMITREAVSRADFDYWLELMAQASCSSVYDVKWAMFHCIGLHGLPFALEVAVTLWELHRSASGWWGNDIEPLWMLRHAIAAADEAAYQQVFDAALPLREPGTDRKLVFSYLFPHIQEWALECLAMKVADPRYLLKDCVMPPSDFLTYVKGIGSIYLGTLKPSLLLQVQLHGEAAFDALAWTLSQCGDYKDALLEALDLVSAMHVPQLIALLVRSIEQREVRAALEKLEKRYPAAILKTAIEQSLASRNRTVEGWTVRLALRQPAALASALASLDEGARSRFEGLLSSLERNDAPAELLPPLLREPPWLRNARQQDLPVVEAESLPLEARLTWSDDERDKARKYDVPHYQRNMAAGEKFPQNLRIKAEGAQRLLRGEPLQPGDVDQTTYSSASPGSVLVSPEQSQLVLWNSYPASMWSSWYAGEGVIPALLAKFGTAALPGFVSFLQAYPEAGLSLAMTVDSPQVADTALHALRNLKKPREAAAAWLRAYPRTALIRALPQAFARNHSAARDNARHGVRWFVANGFEALAREAARSYGDAMAAALDALLAADPLLVLPGKMPKLPSFFVVASFRRPELPGGEALPLTAMEHIGTMLAISRIDAPYPGIDIVKASCTRASLAEFAWDIFEAWIAAGAPSKEGWAFTALGLLGDDETARRLAPRIRLWPGESAHARAVTGLDLLAAIGSDVALMHLNGIAGKVKFKALQERAKEKIAAVAEARGFTAEELADRLVPDLALDESGSLELDFGPRKFYVAFDEALKPYVKDGQGVRLKDLPKPIKSDDAALAEAATERFKQMKKDAKAIASLQVQRLEMAMVSRRRWPAADFKLFFLEHPLMRHLAARVVWGVYEDGKLAHNFRVAEDWTLADGDDERYELSPEASVGISHLLEMPKAALDSFGQVFADYELLQPFKQLGRETYSLAPDELKLHTLTRYKDKVVATGSVMGLVNRGWERGQAQDAGWVGEFSKPLGDELQVDAQLDPGTIVGDMSYEPKQKIPTVVLRKRGTYDQNGLVPFASLDPILASEVLRDLDLLAPAKE